MRVSSSSSSKRYRQCRLRQHRIAAAAAAAAAAAGGGLNDVSLHWLQITSARVHFTSAAEFFAQPKRMRYPPPRLTPVGRRTIRLQGEGGGEGGGPSLSFLCAGVFVQVHELLYPN